MVKVALTGGIATGKSYVLGRLRARGVPCLDADELAHGVTAAGTEATAAIRDRFGDEVIAADGSVNRPALGGIVFADPAARRELEAIVHPAVHRAIAVGLRAFEMTGDYPFAIVDIPLLFETHSADTFDKVIVTACAEDVQLQRMRLRGLNERQARERLAAQMPTDQKVARADFVVRTDGSFEETDRQVDAVLRALSSSS